MTFSILLNFVLLGRESNNLLFFNAPFTNVVMYNTNEGLIILKLRNNSNVSTLAFFKIEDFVPKKHFYKYLPFMGEYNYKILFYVHETRVFTLFGMHILH